MSISSGKLVSSVMVLVGLGAGSLMGATQAFAVCDPASTDPSCPIGQLSLTNPANPASPLNMNNPANPASPLNLSNPSNPASPLNPNNPASAQYQWAHSPNNPASAEYQVAHNPNKPTSFEYQTAHPYYGQPTILDLFGAAPPREEIDDPAEAGVSEPAVSAKRRHHRSHTRHAHLR